MRTANPVLNERSFRTLSVPESSQAMTVQGTVNRTLLLVGLVVLSAAWIWKRSYGQDYSAIQPWAIGGIIGGLVLAIAISFKPTLAPFLSPVYALAEGLFLGAVSAFMEAQYPGLVFQAVTLTLGVTIALLLLYTSGLIRATPGFKKGVLAATAGIALVYLVSWIGGMFGFPIAFLHSNSMLGIGVSLFVVVIAAMNLVLDFDLIENGAKSGAPKHMEWYGAFALLVTLVWLYIEILRLLSKLRRD